MRYFNCRGKKTGLAGDGRLKIAVAGACDGAGCTHLAIMTANYFANVCGMRTVAAECGKNRDYLKICVETDKVGSDYRNFSYKNITFVTGDEDISSVKSMDAAQVVVYDCGCDADEERIFELADERIAVLSASIYRTAKSERFIEALRSDCVYTCMFGGEAQVDKLSKKISGRIIQIPFERDPFCLSCETVGWFGKLFGT